MKNGSFFLFILFVYIFSYSCLFDSHVKKVYGNYYLTAFGKTKKEASLSYKLENGDFIGRIQPQIISYSVFRDKWLFVQQNNDRYYIIDMANDNGYNELQFIIQGPLDYSSFLKKYYLLTQEKSIKMIHL